MFLSGISPAVHHDLQPGGRSPYDGDDGDRTLVVLLTFGIFFSFVILYLVAGLIWAVVITAAAVVLSFLYLRVRRRRAAVGGTAAAAAPNDVVFIVGAHQAARSTGSSGGGGDVAAAAIVSAIPAFEYKRVNGGGGGEDGGAAAGSGWAQCVICLGLVQVGEVVRRLPACKHMFHVECIDAWLSSHSTCPICRADVVDELAAAAAAAAGRLELPV
ncbi:RING-H2 finger protein ATL74-like [Oryza glaberrima]|uniref:RING-H2 finger protein ATL74-like n=1 Tax=Oryza glaberrima TaxID=4538 RepID=UPI00023E296C|nr:RING-H2 finger protein ATL74-like [Oryza glaberrima]